MTADLETNEILIFSTEGLSPEANANHRRAPVFHQYGRLAIADFPGQVAQSPTPEEAPGAELTLTEALGRRGFARRNSPQARAMKQDRPWQGLSWEGTSGDGPGPIHPPGMAMTSPRPAQPGAPVAAPLSARLTGRVAVGLVMVSGPQPHLVFSDADQTLVVAEVQNGLSFLANEAPRKDVTFVHDIEVLSVDAAEVTSGNDFDAYESPWRDAALAQLGHAPGDAGAAAYAEALRQKHGTDWAYVAFFTKYTLAHFAYARLGGPRLVMHFDNDGWGPDQIDRVFAHETGHIFNAPDEYAQSGCDCGGAWGHFGEPNRNCANCAPDGGVKCIMQSNDWAMCDATKLHLGYDGLPGRTEVPIA